MFQSSLFDVGVNVIEDSNNGLTPPYLHLLQGRSLLQGGHQYTSLIQSQGKQVERSISVDLFCDFYRNLNQPDMYSAKPRKGEFKGYVSGYANVFVVKNFTFYVAENTRLKIVNSFETTGKRKKTPHAYIRGELLDAFSGGISEKMLSESRLTSYNPYLYGYLYDRQTLEEVKPEDYRLAILAGANVYLLK